VTHWKDLEKIRVMSDHMGHGSCRGGTVAEGNDRGRFLCVAFATGAANERMARVMSLVLDRRSTSLAKSVWMTEERAVGAAGMRAMIAIRLEHYVSCIEAPEKELIPDEIH